MWLDESFDDDDIDFGEGSTDYSPKRAFPHNHEPLVECTNAFSQLTMDSHPRGNGTIVPKSHVYSHVTPHNSRADDDGWISDPEECRSDGFALSKIQQKCQIDLVNEAVLEQAREIWLSDSKKNSEELICLLTDTFNNHTDVYSFLLCILEKTGKNRLQKHDIRRIIAAEFLAWRERKGESVPQCQPAQQESALEILEKCHHVLFDDICAIFNLHSAKKQSLLSLIDYLMSSYRHTEAVTYATKLGLQQDLDLQETLVPLLATDKINVIENYIQPSLTLQREFVQLLDDLCHCSSKIDALKVQLRRQGILASPVSEINDKLHPRQLEKLGLRLAKKFDVPVENYPNLFRKRTYDSIHYLLKKYKANSISETNFDELVQAAVCDKPHLQVQVIKELTCGGDLSFAAYFARKYKVKSSCLPMSLQHFMKAQSSESNGLRMLVHRNTARTTSSERRHYFHRIRLPSESIFFVHDPSSFCHCQEVLLKPGNVIGIDAEWRLPICNGGVERVALLQLACWQAVFLLDIPKLLHTVPKPSLAYFARELFGSERTLKLGYQIMGDLAMLSKTWSFAEDVLAQPKRVVDLKVFSEMVLGPPCSTNCIPSAEELFAMKAVPSVPPPHPLMLRMMQYPGNHTGMAPSPSQTLLQCPYQTPSHLHSCMSDPLQSHPYLASPQSCPPQSPAQLLVQQSFEHFQPCKEGSPHQSHCPFPQTHTFLSNQPGSHAVGSSSRLLSSHSHPSHSSDELHQLAHQPPVTGLSLLVKRCLGKPLDKSNQFSDWEKRPLSADQVCYAALDAFCLLEVYEWLKQNALLKYPPCLVEPTMEWVRDQEKQKKEREKRRKEKERVVVNSGPK